MRVGSVRDRSKTHLSLLGKNLSYVWICCARKYQNLMFTLKISRTLVSKLWKTVPNVSIIYLTIVTVSQLFNLFLITLYTYSTSCSCQPRVCLVQPICSSVRMLFCVRCCSILLAILVVIILCKGGRQLGDSLPDSF